MALVDRPLITKKQTRVSYAERFSSHLLFSIFSIELEIVTLILKHFNTLVI